VPPDMPKKSSIFRSSSFDKRTSTISNDNQS